MPNDDPYAKYLTPPSTPVGGSDSGDPYAKYLNRPGSTTAPAPAQQHGALYNALFKEGSGGNIFGSADEGVVPALRDYGLAGLDDVTMGLGPKLLGLTGAAQQAQQNLGPMSYVTGAAAYGLGPGKVLGPIGKAIGAYSPIAKGLAGAATEGALAGGISNAVQGGNPLTGAATGAVLGGAGSAIGKGIGKAFDRPGTVDPEAAIAQTTQNSAKTYAQGSNIPINPAHANTAMTSAKNTLDTSMRDDLTSGFENKFNQISGKLADLANAGTSVDANMVKRWQRILTDNTSTSTDSMLAGRAKANLEQLLQNNGAGQWSNDADLAFKQKTMAENLAKWQRQTTAGADIGQAPLTEAERFYQGTPEYQPLADLYAKSQKTSPMSYVLSHMASHGLGEAGTALGGMMGGWGGAALGGTVGEGLGYLFLKPRISGSLKGFDIAQKQRMIQQLYPQYTGIQPTGGRQVSPAIGELVKNAMIGGAY